jgi:hypothetical protein
MADQTTASELPLKLHIERNRTRQHLRQSLLSTLDSLPAATSLTFRSTPSSRSTALFLGYHNTMTAGKTEVWAHVNPDCELVPPVQIFEKTAKKGGKNKELWPRAAASTLLHPLDLLEPFCFMGYEPVDHVRLGIREMLCAVVLYYALAAGASDEARKWPDFRQRLEDALRHIRRDGRYRRSMGSDVESFVAVSSVLDSDEEEEEIKSPGEMEKSRMSLPKYAEDTPVKKRGRSPAELGATTISREPTPEVGAQRALPQFRRTEMENTSRAVPPKDRANGGTALTEIDIKDEDGNGSDVDMYMASASEEGTDESGSEAEEPRVLVRRSASARASAAPKQRSRKRLPLTIEITSSPEPASET